MISKRKTVRFQDNLNDLSVYEAISNYKSYGFRTESHMVIEAVKLLMKKSAADYTADELADKIAERLSATLSNGCLTVSPTSESKSQTDESIYETALGFLDTL